MRTPCGEARRPVEAGEGSAVAARSAMRGILKTGTKTSVTATELHTFARRGVWRPGSAAIWNSVVGGIVLLVYAIVQLVFLQGPYPFDSAKYFMTAVAFPDVPPDIWTLRIGVVMPVTAAVHLFGPSEAAL
jgi:hypothetical protein